MRLLGGVLKDRLTLSLNSRKHQVDGRADGYGVKINSRAMEGAIRPALDDSAVDQLILRAHQRKALQMLVDRTHSEVTAAGQGDLRVMETAEKSAQQIVRRAHTAYSVMGRFIGVDRSGVDIQRVLIHAAHHRAHILQDVGDQGDVGDVRDIFNAAGLVAKHDGGDDRYGSVFRAADGDFTE